MKTLVYSAKAFEIPYLQKANQDIHVIDYITNRLTTDTAMMALGYEAISIFSADDASAIVLEKLKDFGVKYITLRSAGYDNVNLKVATRLGLKIANAPDYSPYAVAEHAVCLLLALNRKIALSRKQTQQHNFSLDNLIGFDLHSKTVGVVGTGKIGSVIVKILHGFGCNILAADPTESLTLKSKFNVNYSNVDTLCKKCDVVILCVPLNEATHQLIDKTKLQRMRKDALLVNVARGAVVHTLDVIEAVETGLIAGYATDVYDKESGVFFYDRSSTNPNDAILDKMLVNDRILLTPHQAFATKEAIHNIAMTTIESLTCWQQGKRPLNELGSS